MNCPDCQGEMENLGNVSGYVMMSCPEQWDDIHVCHNCKVRVSVRMHGKPIRTISLKDYMDRTNHSGVAT